MANLEKLFATLNQTYVDSGIAHVSQIVRNLVLWVVCDNGPNACGLDYKSHRYIGKGVFRAVGVAPTPEGPYDLVANKGHHSRDVLAHGRRGSLSPGQARCIYVGMATMRRAPRSMRNATG